MPNKRQRGVTPWLSGDLKPARRGWYERLFAYGVLRHHWDGALWLTEEDGPADRFQDAPWRGLTCAAFMSPSRYPVARPTHSRED